MDEQKKPLDWNHPGANAVQHRCRTMEIAVKAENEVGLVTLSSRDGRWRVVLAVLH